MLCDRLAAMLRDERDHGPEAYLPQLAHMTLWLPADRCWARARAVVLRVCESNVHKRCSRADRVRDLEENRPEAVRGDLVVRRCASLLQLVEQSVVYGAKLANCASPAPASRRTCTRGSRSTSRACAAGAAAAQPVRGNDHRRGRHGARVADTEGELSAEAARRVGRGAAARVVDAALVCDARLGATTLRAKARAARGCRSAMPDRAA